MAQGQQGFDGVKQGVGIVFLSGNGGRVRRRIYGQIQVGCVAFGEAQVFASVPLHGGAGTGAGIAAFFGGQIQIAHPDFIPVIQVGHAGHGKQESIGQLQLGNVQGQAGTVGIVVAGQQAEITVFLRIQILGQIVFQETVDIAARILFEVTVILTVFVVLIIPHQGGVTV